MPDTTFRGYTFPEYGDTVDFPAQIQQLAEDIDDDVQFIYDNVDNARNAPSAVVTFGGPLALASGVTTNIIWDGTVYDNASMWSAGTPTDISIPQVGNYLITASIRFAPAATGGLAIFIQSAGGFIANPATVTRQPDNDKDIELSVTVLTRCTATTENITLGVRQTSGAPLNVTMGRMAVTKVAP